jgi:2'-5' RNA ligase
MARMTHEEEGALHGTERLFVAIALPESVRSALGGLSELVRGLSWTPREQLHMTLRFLGDVPEDRIGRVEEHLGAVRVQAFILPIGGVGAFPPKGPPRVLWAGVGQGHPHLYQLRQRVDDALLAAGVDLDVRTFQPHVTLARCREEASGAATTWIRRHAEFEGGAFRASSFDLIRSQLLPQGAVHTLRRRFPLAE